MPPGVTQAGSLGYISGRSIACYVKEASDQESSRGGSKTNCHHLDAAFAPVSNQGPGGIDTDPKEGHGTKRDCKNYSRRARDGHEWHEWYQVTDKSRQRHNQRALHEASPLNRLKAQFFIHHRIDPGFAIGCNSRNDFIQKLSLETLAGIDLPDFLAFYLGLRDNLTSFSRSLGEIEVAIRAK